MSPGPRLPIGNDPGNSNPGYGEYSAACRVGSQEVVDPRVLLIKAAGQPLVPLGSEVELDLLSLDHILNQFQCAGPGECLVQPSFVGPFQGSQQPRRHGFQSGLKPLDLLLEQGLVLTEAGRLARDFEEHGAKVVDDRAAVGPDLLGALAHQERRAFTRLAGTDQFLANGGEEAHHQFPRSGL